MRIPKVLFLVPVLGLLTALAAHAAHTASEPVEVRLLRTIHVGALQGIGEGDQKATEVREIGFVAGTLLVQDQFPPLHELAAHWHDIPLSERSREELVREIGTGNECGPRAILALLLAGYLPPAASAKQERRELAALFHAATGLPLEGCYN